MKIKPSNRHSNKVMRYVALKYFQVNDALLWVYFQPAHARSFTHWNLFFFRCYQYTLPMNHSDKLTKEKKKIHKIRGKFFIIFLFSYIIFHGTCSWRYFGLKILFCLVWNEHSLFCTVDPFCVYLRAMKLIFIVLIMTYIFGVYLPYCSSFYDRQCIKKLSNCSQANNKNKNGAKNTVRIPDLFHLSLFFFFWLMKTISCLNGALCELSQQTQNDTYRKQINWVT